MTINSTTMEYQKVIDYIFQMIKDRKLIVGSKIPSERDIAEQLGIGRNSTREAISIMRGMGLIESRHGSGNYIAKNSGRTISNIVSVMLALGSISMKDILECRKIISRTVIELIFINGLEDNEKEYMKKIIDIMKPSSGEQLVLLDQEFHVALIRATHNQLFITVMEAIAQVYHESISKVLESADMETTTRFLEIHNKIYESIVEKDKDECIKYINEHYDFAERQLKNCGSMI